MLGIRLVLVALGRIRDNLVVATRTKPPAPLACLVFEDLEFCHDVPHLAVDQKLGPAWDRPLLIYSPGGGSSLHANRPAAILFGTMPSPRACSDRSRQHGNSLPSHTRCCSDGRMATFQHLGLHMCGLLEMSEMVG